MHFLWDLHRAYLRMKNSAPMHQNELRDPYHPLDAKKL
jgi:hypothetical protein